ncbi:MAG: PstS family phosphate ABC transporter substrate-binding protein [Candidatus Marinimicrobia bacterium]|nr:PstS family phosphate ABC transporter substrate-binding protein [Candidatus Neomarinimicrobiota bacterium]
MKKIIKVLLIVTLALTGCTKKDTTSRSNYLTIKGSDTMVHLASNWAESYISSHADANISVTGGGTGTGIAALINGTTDICIASRKIKDQEIKLARENGDQPQEHVVARDGIAVVVNPDNPVRELTVDQIGRIFRGSYANWKKVNGPDAPILILSRESSSGTYVFFQRRVLNKQDYSVDAMLMPSTSAIIQTVSQDKWSIGYVGLGYAFEAKNRVKILAVLDQKDRASVIPSVEAVKSGAYPIARPLHFYTKGEPTGLAKQFIDFCLSDAGQKIVLETGYVPVN